VPTRTGGYPIGFRRGWGQWQKDTTALAAWAVQAGFEGIDLGRATAADVAVLRSHGLRLGSVDLVEFGQIVSADLRKRTDVVAQNVAYVKEATALGVRAFFTCVFAPDPANRGEGYKLAVEAYGLIAEAAAAGGARVAIEPYPGGWPNYAALFCTPETCRAVLRDLPCGIGLNYDPSHLIRLGVDHVRFLREFAPHVAHVHAKDTELLPEAAYEYGLYQGAAFAKGHGFGEHVWRYTIPGHGQARWTEIMTVLAESGYEGMVSVELEDENFNGTEEGEKAGLTHSLAFLRGI